MNEEQKEYLEELEEKIEQDDLQAKIQWADFFAFDNPEFMNNDEIIEQVISYYEQGVSLGDAAACNNLGSIYYSGVFVKQDFTKAVELYTKAAELGDSQAMCNLGYCYYYGRNVEVDYQKALNWFLLATWENNVNAMYKVGDMYLDEKVLNRNEKMAYRLYSQAYDYLGLASNLEADITYRLAKCLFYGIGTEKDIFQAFKYVQTSEYNYYLNVKNGNDPFAESMLRRTQRLKNTIQINIDDLLCLN